MPNVINAQWDIMSNGKKTSTGNDVEYIINAEWDIMSNGKKYNVSFEKILNFQFSNV